MAVVLSDSDESDSVFRAALPFLQDACGRAWRARQRNLPEASSAASLPSQGRTV